MKMKIVLSLTFVKNVWRLGKRCSGTLLGFTEIVRLVKPFSSAVIVKQSVLHSWVNDVGGKPFPELLLHLFYGLIWGEYWMTWVRRLTSSALGFCDCLLLVGFLGVFSLISMGSIPLLQKRTLQNSHCFQRHFHNPSPFLSIS